MRQIPGEIQIHNISQTLLIIIIKVHLRLSGVEVSTYLSCLAVRIFTIYVWMVYQWYCLPGQLWLPVWLWYWKRKRKVRIYNFTFLIFTLNIIFSKTSVSFKWVLILILKDQFYKYINVTDMTNYIYKKIFTFFHWIRISLQWKHNDNWMIVINYQIGRSNCPIIRFCLEWHLVFRWI